jgi:hypothetical protein
MLGAMDIAVGVLLAVAGLALVGLVAALLARRRTAPPPPPTTDQVDDLPDFLEFPPGTGTRARAASTEVVALAAPPQPAPAPPPPSRSLPTAGLAALAGLVVLLLVAAAVVATASAGSGRREAAAPPDRTTVEARLRFGGIVLEERTVGVTVSYPELVLHTGIDGPVASLELPTWNCLAADAPEDPVGAGCARGRTESAELRSPDLRLTREGTGLRLAGEFPTVVRPAGGDPEPTDRTYELLVTVRPAGTAARGEWGPASGDLELEDRRTSLLEGELRLPD